MGSIADLRKRRTVHTQAMEQAISRYKEAAKEAITESSAFNLSVLRGASGLTEQSAIEELSSEIATKVLEITLSPIESFSARLANANLSDYQMERAVTNLYSKLCNQSEDFDENCSYAKKLEKVAEFFESKPYLYEEIHLFY